MAKDDKPKVCEICGKIMPYDKDKWHPDDELERIWAGSLVGLKLVWACRACRKVEEYIKGERGEKDAHQEPVE